MLDVTQCLDRYKSPRAKNGKLAIAVQSVCKPHQLFVINQDPLKKNTSVMSLLLFSAVIDGVPLASYLRN